MSHDVAGYSGTPLLTKLGIKSAHAVLLDGAPDTLDLGDTERRPRCTPAAARPPTSR